MAERRSTVNMHQDSLVFGLFSLNAGFSSSRRVAIPQTLEIVRLLKPDGVGVCAIEKSDVGVGCTNMHNVHVLFIASRTEVKHDCSK